MKIWIRGHGFDLEPEELEDLRRQLGLVAPVFFTAEEMARALRVSREAIYDNASELGGVKVGSAWRFEPARIGQSKPSAARPSDAAGATRRRKSRSAGSILESRGDPPMLSRHKAAPGGAPTPTRALNTEV